MREPFDETVAESIVFEQGGHFIDGRLVAEPRTWRHRKVDSRSGEACAGPEARTIRPNTSRTYGP
jgi:hypothetical protein